MINCAAANQFLTRKFKYLMTTDKFQLSLTDYIGSTLQARNPYDYTKMCEGDFMDTLAIIMNCKRTSVEVSEIELVMEGGGLVESIEWERSERRLREGTRSKFFLMVSNGNDPLILIKELLIDICDSMYDGAGHTNDFFLPKVHLRQTKESVELLRKWLDGKEM
ncbi:hypothetical protein K435DRAFT_843394 [Dendrothele bispora CBS 962.96]|uniref:Uncharacterized protein n=1 Tax=Dendrothele bispora (strain CBS 962.96) TaxID=1314807 RepID=A0A4S8L8M9_DENBC|nr:hypothetical protein K435DRAFT_843394 [Dendrothele bispora CBS 962.96]